MCRPSRSSWCCDIIWCRASAGRMSPIGIVADRRRRPVVLRRAILGNDAGPGSGIRPLSAKPDGRPVADRTAEFQLHLVSAAIEGDSAIPGQRMPSNILGVPVFALLIWLHAPLWRYFAELIRSLSDRRRTAASSSRAIVVRERGLSDDVCDRVRLFAMDFELGGLHVPDPACGQDACPPRRRCRRYRRTIERPPFSAGS